MFTSLQELGFESVVLTYLSGHRELVKLRVEQLVEIGEFDLFLVFLDDLFESLLDSLGVGLRKSTLLLFQRVVSFLLAEYLLEIQILRVLWH